MSTAARAYLVGGVIVTAVHFVVPPSLGRDLVYAAMGAAAAVAIVVGIRLHRPARRLPWALLAAGTVIWTGGDLLWGLFDHVLGIDPFPSVADVLYLLGYPMIAGGLYQLARARNPRRERTAVLDALVVGVAVALVLWIVFIVPAWTDPEGTLVSRVVAVAYPVADVMLLVQLVHLRTASPLRSVSLRLLGAALAATLLGDLLFQAAPYVAALGANFHLLDATWLLGYTLLGAGALHPSMAPATAPQPELTDARVLGTGQVVFLALTVLVLPATVVAEILLRQEPHLVEVVVAAVAVVALVHLRMVHMSNRMAEQAERLARLAEADALTGLTNRRRFAEIVGAQLAVDDGRPTPVMLVALDRFTEINETLGHRVGDELLCAVADRLTAEAGADGVIARVGGDSFGILLYGCDDCIERALARAVRVRKAVTEPFELSDVTVSVDALVGLAIGPDDGADAEELLQRADVALSVARTRADGVARYSGRMSSGGALTPHLMSELRQALEDGDVVVHYQPQVEVATGRVLGVEALVRWQHPVHGLLPPGAFIPAAERTGLIRPLTLYVLDRALDQFARWRDEGRELRVAVNLSVRNLLDPGFVQDVDRVLVKYGVAEAGLDLEITESMAMVDPNRSMEVLGALDDLGVVLSVDDYGTGHSSLAYLQRLPVRRLKIDRSFVMKLLSDPASAVIVHSTIDLARHLGLTVVAEGVEDDETLLALREMRCHAAQGFGLGRPVPAAEVLPLVDRIEQRLPDVLGVTVMPVH